MENYQKKLDEIIDGLDGRPELVLHSCCAPCSSYVLEYLSRYFDITLLYANSNIYPDEEYMHRLSEQLRLCKLLGIKSAAADYCPDKFFERVKGLENEPEGGARCAKCFEMRLEQTANYAREQGIAMIATTLTVSPHKNASLINTTGERIAAENGLVWLPSDFKKKSGYLRSIRLSGQYGLYRQSYCGCKFSLR